MPTVFFATPCYRSDPQAAADWARNVSTTLGLEGSVVGCPVGAYLTVSQALIIRAFLKSGCSHLFIREDDIFVAPSVLQRMLDADVPAIIAPYLVRNSDPPRLDVVFGPEFTVVWAGVGCTLIRREVIQTLWDRYHTDLNYLQEGVELVDLFFEFFAQRDNGRQKVKPDHAFWYRVRECGFQITALDDVIVDHAGNVSHFKKSLEEARHGN